MKIKRVGDIPGYNDSIEKTNLKNGNKNNILLIIFITIVLLMTGGVIYYFFGMEKKIEPNSDELKLKELELKERELNLKEKNLTQSHGNSMGENNTVPSNDIQKNAQFKSDNENGTDAVMKWVNALGNRDFETAYQLMSHKKSGDFSKFISTKGYGGITGTNIFSCHEVNSYGCNSEVIVDYESFDPYNKDGRYKQKIFLNNCSGKWLITEIENINIYYYR